MSRAARAVAVVCAMTVLVVCAVVLVGWALGIDLLERGLIGTELVRPNAAVSMLFAAASVLLLPRPSARLLSLIPFGLGALTLVQYVANVDFGIDALLFTPDPGVSPRMSIRAAAGAMCAGLAGAIARPRIVSAVFASLTGFIGLLSLTALAYGAELLPNAPVTRIPVASALMLVLWSVAYAARSEHLAFFLRDGWGSMARQLSAVAILIPSILGALTLLAFEAHVFDAAFAIALITSTLTFSLVATIGIHISRVRDADAMYRSIVETSQEGICVVSPELRVTFANRRLAAMLGYAPEELPGKSAYDLIMPEEHAVATERAEARRAGRETPRRELRLRHRDGSPVHVISAATRLTGAALEGHVLATLADISDRVKFENELRASEARFRSLYDANLIGVAFWSLERQVTDANEAARHILGIGPDELPGWTWSALNPPGAQEIDDRAIGEMIERGRYGPFEKELRRPDGTPFWILVAIARLDDETNIAFVVDVTERTEAQRRLERAHEILAARLQQLEGDENGDGGELDVLAARLAEAHEELETFSYSVSHDLRAPLRAIDGFSRELQSEYEHSLDERGQHYLRRVRLATQRMSLLIDDLLNLSRLSRRPLRRSSVDVSAMANEIAGELRERGGARVAFDVAPTLTATADPHLLRIVLENVIGNAVKFSSKRDGARVEVFDAGRGEIAVRDNGAGFDPRYAGKMFAPFQRLHPNEFEGTGIGLALVQRIVRRHGGSIRAESSPGSGATFFLNFPGDRS